MYVKSDVTMATEFWQPCFSKFELPDLNKVEKKNNNNTGLQKMEWK